MLEGAGYEPRGAIRLDNTEVDASEYAVLEELARASTLCNEAGLREHDGAWVVEGDPMEGALLAFAGKISGAVLKQQRAWKRTDAIPFDSQHRFMATLNHNHEGQAFAFVKGAPERILSMCRDQRRIDGGVEPLDESYWSKEADTIAGLGQRVLAFASRSLPSQHTVLEHRDLENTLTFLGMVGMIDPPREEAIAAVKECHEAGIRVKMITGDHAMTAAAIGRQIGLKNAERVLTGADLGRMTAAELKDAVLDCDIFARTSPEHKLRLVMALQSHDLIVAMTGDGVNDAPALKRGRQGSVGARAGGR
jgi:magnesium-transporting ATPase (P-type)